MKRLLALVLALLLIPGVMGQAEEQPLTWSSPIQLATNATSGNLDSDAGLNAAMFTYGCPFGTCIARNNGTDPTSWQSIYSTNFTGIRFINATTWVTNARVDSTRFFFRASHDDGLTFQPAQPLATVGASDAWANLYAVTSRSIFTTMHFPLAVREEMYTTTDFYATPLTHNGCTVNGAASDTFGSTGSSFPIGSSLNSPRKIVVNVFNSGCSLISTVNVITNCSSSNVAAYGATATGIAFALSTCTGGSGTTVNGATALVGDVYAYDTTTGDLAKILTGSTGTVLCNTYGTLDYCRLAKTGGATSVFWRFQGTDWQVSDGPTLAATSVSEIVFWQDRFFVFERTTGNLLKLYYSSEIESPPPPPVEPSEFDTGFVGFVESLGFKTIQSKMLVTIILVGLMTVLMGLSMRIMPASKMKNIVIGGTAVLAAIFCSILGFLPLWMMTLGIVLAGFTYQGFTDFKNTWSEVKGVFEKKPPSAPARTGFVEPFIQAPAAGLPAQAAERNAPIDADAEAPDATSSAASEPEADQGGAEAPAPAAEPATSPAPESSPSSGGDAGGPSE